MKLQTIYHSLSAAITLSADDVALIRECAALHYDRTCQTAAEVGGFLWGWKNLVEWADDQAWIEVQSSDADLVLKILEVAHFLRTDRRVPDLARIRRFFCALCATLNNSAISHLEIDP